MKNITFETGTTTIPKDIFAFCNGIEKVKIPEGVQEIGSSAFRSCENLQEVTLPESLITIGDEAFIGCESLTTVNLPKNLETLGYAAFASCNALESIEIPKSLINTEMPFEHCEGLKTATFEAGISGILPSLFRSCIALENVVIPDSVTEIGEDAFFNCISLKEIAIPDSVEKIGSGAFSCCENLTNLTLSKKLKDAGRYAFAGCITLNKVEIPKSLVNAYAMFDSCNGLKTVTFEEGTTQIAAGLFCDCDGLEEIEVPEGTNYIGDRAFENCTGLEKIVIPRTVTRIATNAFSGADNVTIYCIHKSTAETFAIEQGIKYVAKEMPTETPASTEAPTETQVPSAPEAQVYAFVERMYKVALGRSPDPTGVKFWAEQLLARTNDGAALSVGFILGDEFTRKNYSNAEYITVLYSTFFNRVADEGSISFWSQALEDGSRGAVLAGFVNSREFFDLCGEYGISRGMLRADGSAVNPGIYRFAERLYSKVLERSGDKEGIEHWSLQMDSKTCTPEDAAMSFFFSPEYEGKQTTDTEYIKALYRTFMGREADDSGLSHWKSVMDNGVSRSEVLSRFAHSEEFKRIMAEYGL